MKHFVSSALLGLAALAGSAHAGVVIYDFKAVIDNVMEGSNGNFTTVVDSSTRAGHLLKTGDTITGYFYFDTSAPYSGVDRTPGSPGYGGAKYINSYPPNHTRAGTVATFNGSGYTFRSSGDTSFNTVTVLDRLEGQGRDVFHLIGSKPLNCRCNADYSGSAVTFQDGDGDGLLSSYIPGRLDLDAWDEASYSYFFWGVNGESVRINARFTELTAVVTSPAPVPEPATLGMMAIGMLLVGTRYRRSAKFS